MTDVDGVRERFFDRPTRFWIDEGFSEPVGNSRYRYRPTCILRGPTRLQIAFASADATSPSGMR